MNDTPTQTKNPEKHLRWPRPAEIVFATIALCIIVIILWLLTITGGTPNITMNVAERYTELCRPPDFTEADNAADLYASAFMSLRPMPAEISSYAKSWIGEDDQALLSILADWLKANENAFEYARLAARKPYCWDPSLVFDNSPFPALPHLSEYKHLARALNWQAIYDASRQRHAQAFADLETSYSIALHLKGRKTLVEQLVAMAIESQTCAAVLTVLSNSEADPQTLAQFQAFLQERTPSEALSFNIEHLGSQWYIQKCFTDNGRGGGHVILNEYSALFEFHGSGLGAPPAGRSRKTAIKDTFDSLLGRSQLIVIAVSHDGRRATAEKTEELYALLENIKSQSPWELRTLQTTYRQEIDRVIGPGQRLFLQQLAGAFASVIGIYHRISGQQAAVIAILAITRYKADTGAYPEDLAELQAAGYLYALPQDPYSDQPLIYRTTENGFTLYSRGENFKDDGGTKHQWRSGTLIDPDADYIHWPVQRK